MVARLAGAWTGYHARVSPGRTALHDLASGRRISYGELEDRIARLAGALADGFGVRRGDRVAMLSWNCAQALSTRPAPPGGRRACWSPTPARRPRCWPP
jgi:acyl-CoA synthetase (AMP-forming)/AMP-acid ligase II